MQKKRFDQRLEKEIGSNHRKSFGNQAGKYRIAGYGIDIWALAAS